MTSGKSKSNKDILNSVYKLNYTYQIETVNSTYIEMKSSGALRYFRNGELKSQLSQYYENVVPLIKGLENHNQDYYFDYMEPFVLNHFLLTEVAGTADSVAVENPIFLNRTPATEMKLLNILTNYKINLAMTSKWEQDTGLPKVKELITAVKTAYHLE
jgi:hypothetical protein